MATIIKRNGSFRCQVSIQGVRKSATFNTKRQAELWGLQTEALILAGKPNVKPIQSNDTLTLVDLFEKYRKEVSPLKRGQRWEETRLNNFKTEPMFMVPIDEINNILFASWRDKRLTQVGKGTVKRELTLLSGVLTKAIKEWGVELPRNPLHVIQHPKPPRPRDRRISEEEIQMIVEHFKWDQKSQPTKSSHWVAVAFLLAIETAMRRGELTSFTWGNLHLNESYIHLEITKNGDDRDVPLSPKAKEILAILKPGEEHQRVIPIAPDVLSSLFLKMRNKLGIKNLRFHDTRREATTRLSEKFSNILELSAMTGHKSINILKSVYYKPKASELAKKL